MEQQKRYEVFDWIYEEGMQKRDYTYNIYMVKLIIVLRNFLLAL